MRAGGGGGGVGGVGGCGWSGGWGGGLAGNNKDVYSFITAIFFCFVPENIRTPPQ